MNILATFYVCVKELTPTKFYNEEGYDLVLVMIVKKFVRMSEKKERIFRIKPTQSTSKLVEKLQNIRVNKTKFKA